MEQCSLGQLITNVIQTLNHETQGIGDFCFLVIKVLIILVTAQMI